MEWLHRKVCGFFGRDSILALGEVCIMGGWMARSFFGKMKFSRGGAEKKGVEKDSGWRIQDGKTFLNHGVTEEE